MCHGHRCCMIVHRGALCISTTSPISPNLEASGKKIGVGCGNDDKKQRRARHLGSTNGFELQRETGVTAVTQRWRYGWYKATNKHEVSSTQGRLKGHSGVWGVSDDDEVAVEAGRVGRNCGVTSATYFGCAAFYLGHFSTTGAVSLLVVKLQILQALGQGQFLLDGHSEEGVQRLLFILCCR